MTLLNTAEITVNESVVWVEHWLRHLMSVLVVIGLVTLAIGSPVRAQSVNPCDTPNSLPQSFFEVPTGPQGTWSVSVEPDRWQTEDPRVPVVVAGAGGIQGPANRRGLRLGCGTLRNRSLNPVTAIQLGWSLAKVQDRAVIAHQGSSPDTILLQGHTEYIELSISGNGLRRTDFSVINFNDVTSALQTEGMLDGAYILLVAVHEVRFADGTIWKAAGY